LRSADEELMELMKQGYDVVQLSSIMETNVNLMLTLLQSACTFGLLPVQAVVSNLMSADHELYNVLHIGVQKNVPFLMPVCVHSKKFVQSINEMNVDTQLFCNTHGVPCSAASYYIRGFAVNEFRS